MLGNARRGRRSFIEIEEWVGGRRGKVEGSRNRYKKNMRVKWRDEEGKDNLKETKGTQVKNGGLRNCWMGR